MAPPAKPQKLDLSAGVVDQNQPIDLSSGFDNSPPDDRNAIQRVFDKLTTVTPEQEKDHSWLYNKGQEFGAGAIQGVGQPFIHPLDTLHGIGQMIAHPVDTAQETAHAMEADPFKAAGTFIGGLDTAGVGEAALPRVFSKIPSAGRATRTLEEIRNAARDVPVETTATKPAVQGFKGYLDTGGRPSRPVASLSRRVAPTTARQIAASESKGPMMFPEARDFYTNVSRASARPGVFRRAIESPELPQQRLNIGKVREAMNTDLTNAADQIGRGEDYQNALKEYANAKKVQKVVRGVALLGAGEAARRTGLIGNWIHRTALQQ